MSAKFAHKKEGKMDTNVILLIHLTLEYYLKLNYLGKKTETDVISARFGLVNLIEKMLKSKEPEKEWVFELLLTVPENDMLMRDTMVTYLFRHCRTVHDVVRACEEISTSSDSHTHRDPEVIAIIAKIMETTTEEALDAVFDSYILMPPKVSEKMKKYILSCRQ